MYRWTSQKFGGRDQGSEGLSPVALSYPPMVECPRCDRDVDSLHMVTPDVITRELMDRMGQHSESQADEGGFEVCAECLDELNQG